MGNLRLKHWLWSYLSYHLGDLMPKNCKFSPLIFPQFCYDFVDSSLIWSLNPKCFWYCGWMVIRIRREWWSMIVFPIGLIADMMAAIVWTPSDLSLLLIIYFLFFLAIFSLLKLRTCLKLWSYFLSCRLYILYSFYNKSSFCFDELIYAVLRIQWWWVSQIRRIGGYLSVFDCVLL